MQATFTSNPDGSEGRVIFTPDTELDRKLLKVLISDFTVVTCRAKAGTANLLEWRAVVNGVDCHKK